MQTELYPKQPNVHGCFKSARRILGMARLQATQLFSCKGAGAYAMQEQLAGKTVRLAFKLMGWSKRNASEPNKVRRSLEFSNVY
jgi:hypothetical protein